MKAGLDEHSLPLVNLTVDSAALNRYSFVTGEIEIADYWHRTDPSPDSICRRLDDYAWQFTASGAWARERERWDGNPVPLKADIMEELDYVKGWYARNFESLCNQFGRVRLSVPAVTHARHPSVLYDLQGRRLSGVPQRGVYIRSGRKVVVK